MEIERQYKRVYDKDKNVYVAAMERLDYIFNNFERIYLSFSGGKDSGVMLNLTIDYMRERE
jgi:predicted phosphoadenosine phosphosulfate sulfurtransferase